jgi:hypothetical protein
VQTGRGSHPYRGIPEDNDVPADIKSTLSVGNIQVPLIFISKGTYLSIVAGDMAEWSVYGNWQPIFQGPPDILHLQRCNGHCTVYSDQETRCCLGRA